MLNMWKRKILRKLYGPATEQDLITTRYYTIHIPTHVMSRYRKFLGNHAVIFWVMLIMKYYLGLNSTQL
jgi:hypothetical protein